MQCSAVEKVQFCVRYQKWFRGYSQYIGRELSTLGGYHQFFVGIPFGTLEDIISAVVDILYCGEMRLVLWRILLILWMISSTIAVPSVM